MFKMSADKNRWLEILWAMVERNVKARFKLTKLGFIWMLVYPVLQMVIIGFVFQFFIPVKMNNYFIFVLIGIITWNYFNETVSKNVSAVVDQRSLIQNSNFPRELIIWSNIITNFIYFLIPFFLLIILIVGSIKLTWFFIPFVLILLVLITSGFSFLFSALNVKYRDLKFIFSAVIPLWFYGTPILYSLDILPKNISWFFYINPMASIIELFRFVLLGLPIFSLKGCLFGIICSIFLFIIGIFIFKRKSLDFNDWI